MTSLYKIILYVALLVNIFVMLAQAADVDRELRRGRRDRRGNENSERVTQITVGNATYGGNGCPQGTMQMVFAPDNLSFSILFDQFIAEVRVGATERRDMMSCELLVPIQIPEGKQMEITRVDIRGFVGLPENSRAVLSSILNFRGGGGDGDRIKLRYKFMGPSIEDYELSSDVLSPNGRPSRAETSPCGGRTTLRIQNEVRVVSARNQEATATIDSIDGAARSEYFVNWRNSTPPSRR